MQLPGGVERRLNVHSGEAQVDGRAGRALLLCSPQNLPSTLCFGQWGWGEGFKPSEFLQESSGLVQAAIASHVGVIINAQLPLSLRPWHF